MAGLGEVQATRKQSFLSTHQQNSFDVFLPISVPTTFSDRLGQKGLPTKDKLGILSFGVPTIVPTSPPLAPYKLEGTVVPVLVSKVPKRRHGKRFSLKISRPTPRVLK